MIARFEQPKDTVDGSHARSEGQAVPSALKGGDVLLKSSPRGIGDSGVLVPFVLPDLLLNVRRCEVHRHHDRPRGRIGLLACMDGPG